jgi:excisionase family DNA binding protein
MFDDLLASKPDDDFLTPAELASELGISERGLYLRLRKGRLPAPVRFGPRRIKFSRKAVAKFLGEHSTEVQFVRAVYPK